MKDLKRDKDGNITRKGNDMEHAQILYDKGDPFIGALRVSGYDTREECVRAVVASAINTNMKPPHKWLLWRHHWPTDVMAEYEKQSAQRETEHSRQTMDPI